MLWSLRNYRAREMFHLWKVIWNILGRYICIFVSSPGVFLCVCVWGETDDDNKLAIHYRYKNCRVQDSFSALRFAALLQDWGT